MIQRVSDELSIGHPWCRETPVSRTANNNFIQVWIFPFVSHFYSLKWTRIDFSQSWWWKSLLNSFSFTHSGGNLSLIPSNELESLCFSHSYSLWMRISEYQRVCVSLIPILFEREYQNTRGFVFLSFLFSKNGNIRIF